MTTNDDGVEPIDTAHVWVRTVPDPITGVYYPVVEYGADATRALNREEAVKYVGAVALALAYATYDAAVISQMLPTVKGDGVAYLVGKLRADRPPIDDAATEPFRFVPIVSNRTQGPMVVMYLGDAAVTQWTPDDVRRHLFGVLSAPLMADMDQHYLTALRGLDLPVATAQNVIGALAEHVSRLDP